MKRATASWLIPILCLLMLCSCGKSPAEQWQEQYDLGVRYLSEGNYEEAIIAFTAAIEIDPNRAEAYVSRGNAYAASGDTEENMRKPLRYCKKPWNQQDIAKVSEIDLQKLKIASILILGAMIKPN